MFRELSVLKISGNAKHPDGAIVELAEGTDAEGYGFHNCKNK